MAFAPLEQYDRENVVGQFRNNDTKVYFDYSNCAESERFFGDRFCHKVWVRDGFRCAEVKKTVAYVVVDEDEGPMVEKWPIREIWRKDD